MLLIPPPRLFTQESSLSNSTEGGRGPGWWARLSGVTQGGIVVAAIAALGGVLAAVIGLAHSPSPVNVNINPPSSPAVSTSPLRPTQAPSTQIAQAAFAYPTDGATNIPKATV